MYLNLYSRCLRGKNNWKEIKVTLGHVNVYSNWDKICEILWHQTGLYKKYAYVTIKSKSKKIIKRLPAFATKILLR